VALQISSMSLMMVCERWALRYKISVSSKPARDANGVQSSVDLGGDGAGGIPDGRKEPRWLQGDPLRSA
jgi:hypothetical protein